MLNVCIWFSFVCRVLCLTLDPSVSQWISASRFWVLAHGRSSSPARLLYHRRWDTQTLNPFLFGLFHTLRIAENIVQLHILIVFLTPLFFTVGTELPKIYSVLWEQTQWTQVDVALSPLQRRAGYQLLQEQIHPSGLFNIALFATLFPNIYCDSCRRI